MKILLTIILTAVVATGLTEAKEPKQSRPNVILILSDDMGYSDLPKFGKSEIPTPAIDRLAEEGTLFSDAYVTAPTAGCPGKPTAVRCWLESITIAPPTSG